MTWKQIVLGLCMGLTAVALRGQVADTTPVLTPNLQLDSIAAGPRTYEPRKTLLWAIVPGGGQVYNRRWWKVPLVFGAFSGVAALWDFNQSNYNRFSTAYELELAGEPHEFTGVIADADRLKVFRDNFNRSRQTTAFALVAVYVLQGVEAYVDTHLRQFDISEDLSQWQVRPTLLPGGPTYASAMALNITFTF